MGLVSGTGELGSVEIVDEENEEWSMSGKDVVCLRHKHEKDD